MTKDILLRSEYANEAIIVILRGIKNPSVINCNMYIINIEEIKEIKNWLYVNLCIPNKIDIIKSSSIIATPPKINIYVKAELKLIEYIASISRIELAIINFFSKFIVFKSIISKIIMSIKLTTYAQYNKKGVYMSIILVRSLVIYLLVFVVIRIMGKRELSQLQPFEFIIIIMIADLAAGPIASTTIPLINGVAAIICLLLVYITFTILIQTSNFIQKIMCGKEVVIISRGKIIEKELRKQQYTIEDLFAQIRKQGKFKISDIQYAVLEINGDLNIVNNDKKFIQMPVLVISDGRIKYDSLDFLKLPIEYIDTILKEKNLELKNILYAILDENNQFVYQLKEN